MRSLGNRTEKPWTRLFRKLIDAPASTIGVDTYDLHALNVTTKVEIVVWDFAGQLEYLNNHKVDLRIKIPTF